MKTIGSAKCWIKEFTLVLRGKESPPKFKSLAVCVQIAVDGAGTPKGFGFVQYDQEEDALRSVDDRWID